MTLSQIREALRIELGDTEALWSDAELSRAIVKAVADIDRFFPLEEAYEITFKYAVADESWTTADEADPVNWTQLANKPISYSSEIVKSTDGATTFTRDTDYTMDYTNGKIIRIAGKMARNTAYKISYAQSKIALDLSALSIIRIQRVEYPYGKVPQSFESYDFFNNKLWLTGIETEAQAKLADGKHIVIYYLTQNTAPTIAASGSYPRHLDEVVAKGASAYACFIKALQYEHQAATDFTSARSRLAAISHAKVATALDAIATKLGLPSYTKIATALDAIASKLGSVDTYLTGAVAPSVKKYLDDGAPYLNQVTVGADVAANYAIYAQRSSDIAVALIREATEYGSEAEHRLAEIDRYLAQATGYTAEARERLDEVNGYIAEATQYITIAVQNLGLAERFRTEGINRQQEFWTILRDRAELRGRALSSASPRQLRT